MKEQKSIKKLRDKIISAVPEIMELKFGCKTEYGIITRIKGTQLFLDGLKGYVSKGQVKRGICKIIGRTITLADVLFTLNQLVCEKSCETLKWYHNRLLDVLTKWNWSDNNLDYQSPETKKFLEDLLT